MRQPKNITICNLEVIVMPNGEVICNGISLGFMKKFSKYLSVKVAEQ